MMGLKAWKSAYDSLVGTSHIENEIACQDSCRLVTCSAEGSEILIAVCADGAGSSSHSDEGSKLACDQFIELCQSNCNSDEAINALTHDNIDEWLICIREAIVDKADQMQVELRELATTLVGCVIGVEASMFLQIGDGAALFRQQDRFEYAFWPHSGEFANTTNFITSDDYDQKVEWKIVNETIHDLVLFTDGLERLILKFEDQTIHEPAIVPMLSAIQQSTPDEDFFEPLRAFLDSGPVNDRTDDDKTLILATRLPHGDAGI